MTTSDDEWWATGLEDEPCDGCGTRPSKHRGHGSYTCRACDGKRWCKLCGYDVRHGVGGQHVCVTPEENARYEAETRDFFASIDIEYPED